MLLNLLNTALGCRSKETIQDPTRKHRESGKVDKCKTVDGRVDGEAERGRADDAAE